MKLPLRRVTRSRPRERVRELAMGNPRDKRTHFRDRLIYLFDAGMFAIWAATLFARVFGPGK